MHNPGDSFSEGHNLGGSLAMPMYALGVNLIQQLTEIKVHKSGMLMVPLQGDNLRGLHCRWDKLSCGYFPNPIKTYLIVKPSLVHRAQTLFRGTGIVISGSGKHLLGSTIGSEDLWLVMLEVKLLHGCQSLKRCQ